MSFAHQTAALIPGCTVGIKTDAKCASKIELRIVMGKAAFNQAKKILINKLDLNLRKRLEERYIQSVSLYVAKTWTFRKIDQK